MHWKKLQKNLLASIKMIRVACKFMSFHNYFISCVLRCSVGGYYAEEHIYILLCDKLEATCKSEVERHLNTLIIATSAKARSIRMKSNRIDHST
jgi:hypothetical protein